MALERVTHPDGTWEVKASGRDVQALRGAFGDVKAQERDARLSGEHPAHRAPGVAMLFQPPQNIVGWKDGRIVYPEPQGPGEWQRVQEPEGWVLVA